MDILYDQTKNQLQKLLNMEGYDRVEVNEFLELYNSILTSNKFYIDCPSAESYIKNYSTRKNEYIQYYQNYPTEKEFIQKEKEIFSQMNSILNISYGKFNSSLNTHDLPFMDLKTCERTKILNYLNELESYMSQDSEIVEQADETDMVTNNSTAKRLRMLYVMGFFNENVLAVKNLTKYVKVILDTDTHLDSHISAIKKDDTANKNHPQYSEDLFDELSKRLKKDGFKTVKKIGNY